MRNYTRANTLRQNLFQQLIYVDDSGASDIERQIANCANHHAT